MKGDVYSEEVKKKKRLFSKVVVSWTLSSVSLDNVHETTTFENSFRLVKRVLREDLSERDPNM